MKNSIKSRLLVMLAGALALTGTSLTAEMTINGAGASFPAPVYGRWTYNYGQQAGVRINYQSLGSGAGIQQIKARTVDFGASDEPLTVKELDASGLIQFPMLMGGVVPIVNLPGVKSGELTLSGPVLADIFLGKIKKWNEPAIKDLNKNLTLPETDITVVHRADGSGTTWIFTNYLTKVSPAWAKGPGNDKAVNWPCGIGGQKNPGVANNVQKTLGAIGYVEYTYAVEAKLAVPRLINRAGAAVAPAIASFQAAGASADWRNSPGFHMVLTDQPGQDTWPITGVTYILLPKDQKDAAKLKAMLAYFDWCFVKGAKDAIQLNYVPMPENVVKMVKEEWRKINAAGKPAAQ